MLDTSHIAAVFRGATPDDIDEIVGAGERFFAESEFKDFSEYSPENFRRTLGDMLNSEASRIFVFLPDGRHIEGFVAFQFSFAYTREPIALLFLLYVAPEFRRSPAGRLLMQLAMADAKAQGAVAFYAGAMARMGPSDKTLANMYRKLGFEDLGFWGRAVL